MSNTDITIKRAIIHIIEPKGRGFQPSAGHFVPEADVAQFLASHIAKSRQDTSLRTCAFADPTGDTIGTWLTDAAVRDDATFTELTKKSAERLFATMSLNKSISDGSAVTVDYRIGSSTTPALALLKMDPAPGFATESSDGTHKITRREAMLPSKRERLHKCAFVEHDDAASMLTVLDLQRDAKGKIRHWFLGEYLNAGLALTDSELTDVFYNSAMRGANKIGDESRKRRFQASVSGAIAAARVNVTDFLDNADLVDGEREQLETAFTPMGRDRDFDVDPDKRDQLLAKVRFTGQGGLRLQAPSTTFDSSVTVTELNDPESPQPPTQQPRDFRITIETNKWSQQP